MIILLLLAFVTFTIYCVCFTVQIFFFSFLFSFQARTMPETNKKTPLRFKTKVNKLMWKYQRYGTRWKDWQSYRNEIDRVQNNEQRSMSERQAGKKKKKMNTWLNENAVNIGNKIWNQSERIHRTMGWNSTWMLLIHIVFI